MSKVGGRLTTFFFLATVFSVSFQNVYWNVAGRVNLADILALFFLVMVAQWLGKKFGVKE